MSPENEEEVEEVPPRKQYRATAEDKGFSG